MYYTVQPSLKPKFEFLIIYVARLVKSTSFNFAIELFFMIYHSLPCCWKTTCGTSWQFDKQSLVTPQQHKVDDFLNY